VPETGCARRALKEGNGIMYGRDDSPSSGPSLSPRSFMSGLPSCPRPFPVSVSWRSPNASPSINFSLRPVSCRYVKAPSQVRGAVSTIISESFSHTYLLGRAAILVMAVLFVVFGGGTPAVCDCATTRRLHAVRSGCQLGAVDSCTNR
jgi:hypothetical protein